MDHHRPARLHYAWVILAVTCLTVVMTAGVTAVPAVLIHPLEVAFGWDRAAIALAVSINVFLYGLAGPFAGRVMLRVGPRRVMLTSLLLIAAVSPPRRRSRPCSTSISSGAWWSAWGRGVPPSCSAPPWSIAGSPPSGAWPSGCWAPRAPRGGWCFFPCSPPSSRPWAGRPWGGSWPGACS